MSSRKPKGTPTDNTEETTESVEQTGQDQGLASIAMVDNARAKLAAIASRTEELQGLIDKKTSQIDEIETAIAACEQHYEESEQVHNDLGQRVTRETVKLDISKGTMAEEERAEIFASVVRVFEKAQKALAQAVHDRDEARERQGLAQSIREEIEEHRREVSDLALVRREYDAVLEEVHAQKGRELAQSIADSIIATRDSYEACEQELKDRKAAHEAATESINTLREEYPELAKELWASHGHLLYEEPEKTHGEAILENLRAYTISLLEHGPHARIWVFEHKQKFADYLALDPSIVAELMKGTWQRKRSYDAWGRPVEGSAHHARLDLIDKLIKDERQNISQRRPW